MKTTIDYNLFNSDVYLKILLANISPKIQRVRDLDGDSIAFFQRQKNITPDNIEWDEEYAECVDIYFQSKFFYRVANSVYVGIYTNDYGNSYIIKNYDGYFFDFVGDNLSNWAENFFISTAIHSPEVILKFRNDCFQQFGTDPNSKYDD